VARRPALRRRLLDLLARHPLAFARPLDHAFRRWATLKK
jgi:hypothetical protein